jgi:hypothetical protein
MQVFHGKNGFYCAYEHMKADYPRRRILKVACDVRRVFTTSRKSGVLPLCGSMKEYLKGATAVEAIGLDGGHLIGLSLGGIDEEYNIVPMFGHFNESTYRNIELQIWKDPDVKRMGVVVTYDDGSDRPAIPSKFQIYVDGGSKSMLANNNNDKIPSYDVFRGKVLVEIEMKTPVPTPYPFDKAVRDEVEAILPAVKSEDSPYAFLDVLAFNYNTSTNFSEEQRQYILTANALWDERQGNGGFITRDNQDDPFPTLNLQGGNDRPQIDHVVPKGWGGTNAFSNAKVTSKVYNNQKRAKVPPETKAALLSASRRNPGRSVRAERERLQPYPKSKPK